MGLNLPKLSALTPSMAYSVGATLTTVIAGRSGARTTYQFYEELDAWLGPWGESGYPIGYGKKYNIAFSTDPILTSPHFPITSRWVRQTGINLQLALVDSIVDAIRSNTLYRLTREDQIRSTAFNSHPGAYLRGGLRDVAGQEPACIPVIATIPWEQFNPVNPSFAATFDQIVDVIREPGVMAWLNTILVGTNKLPRDCMRVMVETAEDSARRVRDRALNEIIAARRFVLNKAQQALLRPFMNLTDRYQPLRRFFF
jgi:hypothetical protein